MARWLTADPTRYWQLPHVAAVYVLQIDGRTLYVGQTVDISRRFSSYRMRLSYGEGTLTPWGQVEGSLRLKFSPSVRYGDWAMRELRLIRRLQPQWNCLGSVAPRGTSGHKASASKAKARTTNNFVSAKYAELMQGAR